MTGRDEVMNSAEWRWIRKAVLVLDNQMGSLQIVDLRKRARL